MLFVSAILALATSLSLVTAHGGVDGIFIDDQFFPAPDFNDGNPGPSAFRVIHSIDPVKGVDNPDLICGHGATQPGQLTLDAQVGSKIGITWVNGERGVWVHNKGPVLTYMAKCDGPCSTFDPAASNVDWFKISEYGKKEDGLTFYLEDLTHTFNSTLDAFIPAVPEGEYLVRHEIIAMHQGDSEGGAEFYPGCVQLKISGPGTQGASLPSADMMVKIPGLYKVNDAGIVDHNIYTPGTEYPFPGPAVYTAAATTEPVTPSESPAITESPVATTSSAAASPSSPCNKQKRAPHIKRVYKRVYSQGPLVEKSSHKREVIPQKRYEPAQPIARSRVMRGV